MKWRSHRGKYLDKENMKTSLVGTPRKMFALWPKELFTKNVVWLSSYYAVYITHPSNGSSFGGVYEYYFETYEEAKDATWLRINLPQ